MTSAIRLMRSGFSGIPGLALSRHATRPVSGPSVIMRVVNWPGFGPTIRLCGPHAVVRVSILGSSSHVRACEPEAYRDFGGATISPILRRVVDFAVGGRGSAARAGAARLVSEDHVPLIA